MRSSAPVVLCAIAGLSGFAGEAAAQVSGSVSLVSNYVYRGVSLSDGNPEAQLNLNLDFDSGWFAGAFATPVDLPGTHAQAIAYGGYAHQWNSDLSWETGVSETAYSGNASQNYAEGFVGLSSERFNGRFYYAPNYLGQSMHSAYAELNYNLPLSEKLRLTVHGGYLWLSDEDRGGDRADGKVGLGYRLGDWNLQWAVATLRETTTSPYHRYPQVSQHMAGVFDAVWNF